MATAHRTLPLAATVLWLCLLPHAEGLDARLTQQVMLLSRTRCSDQLINLGAQRIGMSAKAALFEL